MRKNNPKDNGVKMPFNDDLFIEKWAEWLEFRKERRQPNYVPRGLKGTLTELFNMSSGDSAKAIAIIQRSMDKNWIGLHPLPQNHTNGQHSTSTIGKTFEPD